MSPAQNTIEHGLLLEEQMEWETAVEVYTALLAGAGGADAELAFRLGHAHFHLRQFDQAATHLQTATSLQHGMASWHYRLGYVQEQLGLLAAAAENYVIALELEPHRDRWQRRLSAVRAAYAISEPELSLVLAQRRNPDYHSEKLTRLRENKGPLWQELEILTAGKKAHEGNAAWLAQLGAAQFGMKRFGEAAATYAEANAILPGNAEWYFYEGHANALSGQTQKADEAYALAVSHDKNFKSDVVGIGAFFQKKGAWVEALGHYQDQLRRQPANAEVAYRVGLAFDRCYRWAEAAKAYEDAITLKPDVPYWHYKLGLARERNFQWLEAGEAYGDAWRLDASKKYRAYRAGYALETAGRAEQACEYYLVSASYPVPPSSADSPSAAEDRDGSHLKDLLEQIVPELAAKQSS